MPSLVTVEFIDEDGALHGYAHARGGALADDTGSEHGAPSGFLYLDDGGLTIQAGDGEQT